MTQTMTQTTLEPPKHIPVLPEAVCSFLAPENRNENPRPASSIWREDTPTSSSTASTVSQPSAAARSAMRE